MTLGIPESIRRLNALICDRLSRFPGHPLFLHAANDVSRIEARLLQDEPLDETFYESLNIGLLCAREFETVDPPFCEAVYAMLEKIRISCVQGR